MKPQDYTEEQKKELSLEGLGRIVKAIAVPDEPNETPDGILAEYLIGDLGPARRHIARLLNNELPPSRSVLMEIQASIARCIRRIERDSPIAAHEPPAPATISNRKDT